MISINGIGGTFYGKRDINSQDGSYITTKWATIFFLPIFPEGSYRVRLENMKPHLLGNTRQYEIINKVPNNRKQIINTLLTAYIPLLAWFIFLTIVVIE